VQLHSFFNLGARWWWAVNPTPRPLHPLERELCWVVAEPIWTVSENHLSAGFNPRTVQAHVIRDTV